MQLRIIYDYCKELEPFIMFDAKLENGEIVSCVGHEWHCCDPKCKCYLTNIMVHDSDSGDRLAQIIYGWRNYEYYRKERFCKNEIKEFSSGYLSPIGPRNEHSTTILASFKLWLSSKREQKIKLFTERYKQFKAFAKSKDFDEIADFKMFLYIINRLAKTGRLDELILKSE